MPDQDKKEPTKFVNVNATLFPPKTKATREEVEKFLGFTDESEFDRLVNCGAIAEAPPEPPPAPVNTAPPFDENAYEARLSSVLLEGGWTEEDVAKASAARRDRNAHRAKMAQLNTPQPEQVPPLKPEDAPHVNGSTADPAPKLTAEDAPVVPTTLKPAEDTKDLADAEAKKGVAAKNLRGGK